MNDSSAADLAELVAVWPRLTPDAQASLLQIAQAKAGLVEHVTDERSARRQTLATCENDVRRSQWTLLQKGNRTLHVEQRAKYPEDDDEKIRTVSINEFMQENGPAPRWLQELINRMFEDGDRSGGTATPCQSTPS